MKRAFGILLLAVFFCASCGKDMATWQEKYDLGIKYLEESNYEEAILAFSEAIKIDSKQPKVFIGRGDAYAMIEDDYKKAIADYEQALELDELCIEAYISLSDIYLCKEDTEKAKAVLKEGYKITKNDRLSKREEEITELNFPIELKFERKDHSLYSDDNQTIAKFYYDLPSVSKEHLQGRKINADLQKIYEEYLQEVKDLKKEETFDIDQAEYLYTWSGKESYQKDGILSIYFGTDWCMGGVHNAIPHGFTYDLGTGKRMNLQDLFKMDPDELLTKIKTKLVQKVMRNTDDSDQAEEKKKTIEGYDLDSFDFYISSDGELVICIPVYELGIGAEGSFEIPCDIYLNSSQENKANHRMDGKTVFSAEFIGKTVNELSKYYGGSYYIGAYEGASYVEYADSPCFFVGEVVDTLRGDENVTMLFTDGNSALLDGLTGNMTYPEIVKAVGNEVVLEQPVYYQNLMDDVWMYTLSFDYKGYRFGYDWHNDPNTSKSDSASVSVSK
ncbi:tetratricopeptide repeat protein [Anaerotignum faecicola]